MNGHRSTLYEGLYQNDRIKCLCQINISSDIFQEEWRMGKQKVYVLLTDTGTLFTRIIKFFTKKPYNHASIGFDNGLFEIYSFGRKQYWNPFFGGFVKENIRFGLFKKASCAIYSCSLTETQFQKMHDKVRKFEKDKDDYKYNLIGLFAILFNIKIERKNAYFCSHFVADILNESGAILINKPLSLITPDDLKEISCLTLIYQGDLASYLTEIDTESTELNSRYFHCYG